MPVFGMRAVGMGVPMMVVVIVLMHGGVKWRWLR
jgi:hypothetical protein